MENIKTQIKDGKLLIQIDLNHLGEVSSSGKSHLVASTRGNQEIVEGIMLGINCFKPIPKDQRVKPEKAEKADKPAKAKKSAKAKKAAPADKQETVKAEPAKAQTADSDVSDVLSDLELDVASEVA